MNSSGYSDVVDLGSVSLDDYSLLYSDVKHLKGIRKSSVNGSLIERLLFEKGEIVLKVGNGVLEAHSISYSRKSNPITHRSTLTLRKGISQEQALSNAIESIVTRLRHYEKVRELKTFQSLPGQKSDEVEAIGIAS